MFFMPSMQACARLSALAFFVTAALWIGTLFSVSWLSGSARMMADGPEIGRLARSLFRRWTVPSLLGSVLAGLAWAMATVRAPPPGPWIYPAVVVAVVLVWFHFSVGRRATRIVQGSVQAARGERIQRLALLVSVVTLVALATFHSTLIP